MVILPSTFRSVIEFAAFKVNCFLRASRILYSEATLRPPPSLERKPSILLVERLNEKKKKKGRFVFGKRGKE